MPDSRYRIHLVPAVARVSGETFDRSTNPTASLYLAALGIDIIRRGPVVSRRVGEALCQNLPLNHLMMKEGKEKVCCLPRITCGYSPLDL